MKWTSLVPFLCLGIASVSTAQTVPDLVDFQGYLRTESGQPVTKTVSMKVSLYDASSGGSLLYSENEPSVPVYGGRFSIQVGTDKPIPPDLFGAHPQVFLGLSVEGSPELPRQQIVTTPYTFRSRSAGLADVAAMAKDLDCAGCVTTGKLSDQSVTASKLGEPCQEGQFLARVGGVWQCATLPAYSGKDFALSSQACEAGQKVQGIGNDGTLVCGDDEWQAYTAGTGLVLDSAKFSLDLGYADGRYVNAGEANSVTGPMLVDGVVTASKLGEPCKAGEVLKMGPGGWGCGPDSDTKYGGTDFATSGQWCGAGQVVQGIGADGKVKCGVDAEGVYTAGPGLDLSEGRFSLLPGCGDGEVPKWDTGAKDWRCGADQNTQVVPGTGLKVSGAVLSVDSATVQGWARDVCYDVPSELAEALSGWDQKASDDLTVGTVFGGDVTGKYDALTIGVGKVTDAKIASVSWTKLTGIPEGFADGTDDGTTYTGGAGISIAGTTISIATGGVTNGMLANPSLTVTAGPGLSGGGPVSLGGTTALGLANTAVTPGKYTRATVTVDAHGRVTSATSGGDIGLGTDVSGVLPVANGGTGATTASGARANLSAAERGVNADITGLTRLNTQAALTLLPYGTTANDESEIRFLELAANGANYVGLKAPDAIAKNVIWSLPVSDGLLGQVLQTNGAGDLSWASVGTGSVTQVNSGSGLTGGPITTSGTLSIATGGVTNAMLQNASLTVGAGTGLTGGGPVSLGGTTTLGLANTTVTPGTYTRATVTVDGQGRLTSAASGAAIALGSDVSGILPVSSGGTGATTAFGARANLSAASSGANADITSLSGLNTQAALTLLPYGTKTDDESEVRFLELAANGTNYVGLKAPDAIAASRIWTLPSADGTSGQVLKTDGTGNLGWASVGTGSVTQVNSGSGLTGGPITTSGTLSIATGGVTNAMLQNASLTVTAGTGLSGGGPVSLGGTTTLGLANSGVTAGTYTRATVTVDAQGRLTSASSGAAIALGSDVSGVLPVANGGTGATTASGARTNLSAAESGVNGDITGLTRLNTQAAVTLLPYGTTTDDESEVRFLELAANGVQYVGFKAPDSIATSRIWTLPAADGASGQVLRTNGSGDLDWASVGTGSVTQVNTGSGLTGGPITTSGTISIATGGVTNAMLQNASVTVSTPTGSGLSGGGPVALGGSLSLSIPSSGVSNAMLASSSVTVTAGTGLSGGGTISLGGSATLNLANTAVAAGSYTRANLTVDAQGRLTSASSGAAINLGSSSEVTGVLAAANGGTGQSSYTIGDLLYASSNSALAKLGDVATGNTLLSGGVGTAPAWGKVGLTTHVSGTLPVSNGGTGTASVGSAGSVAYSNGSALGFTAAGTSGQYLKSGGTGAPTWGAIVAGDLPAGSSNYIQNQYSSAQSGDLWITGNAKLGGALVPSVGAATNGILWPANPGGGSGDQAWIQYSVTSGEDTKLTIGNDNGSADVIALHQSGADRLTVADGKVGINMPLPLATLDVSGSMRASGNTNIGGNLWVWDDTYVAGTLLLQDTAQNLIRFLNAGLGAPSDTSTGWKIQFWTPGYGVGINNAVQWYSSEGNHRWYNRTSGGAYNERMNLDASGNLTTSGNVALAGNVVYGTLPDYRMVYRDEFQSGYAGWSGTTTTQVCGTATILGGYGALAGGTVSKTFSLSGITHSKVLVRLDYYAIDSWDGEMAYVEVGGWRCWERWPNMGQGGNNICGNSSGHRDAVYLAECAVPHTASTITVVVGSSLNQDPTDESFGIDDVEIWVR